MTEHTRMVNRFKGYSIDDCACKLCLYFRGKVRGCALEKCDIEDELREAYERKGITPKPAPYARS